MGIEAGAGEGGRAGGLWAVSCQRDQQAFGTSWPLGGRAGRGWFVWDPAANLAGIHHCRHHLLETGRHKGSFQRFPAPDSVQRIPGGCWDWANSAFLGGEPRLWEPVASQG